MEHVIELNNVVKRYGGLTAVDGLDLTVPPGSCQGLLGPNGAGKTTTVGMLVGLTAPDSGEVRILGESWRNGAWIRERIGVQLQETQFFDKLSVTELLALFASFYRTRRPLGEVLALVGLEEKAGARYKTLSGGQKQRLALGCALVNEPAILFLDEPTTGLDPQARRRMWEVVSDFKQAGGTVLLTTHYMDEAERLCDHIVIVDHGRAIARGTPRELIASLGARNLVEFTVANGVTPSPAALEALPAVLRVQTDDSRYTLHVDAVEAALPALLAAIAEQGVALEDLRTHRPTLEDVFVALTGRHLRDG